MFGTVQSMLLPKVMNNPTSKAILKKLNINRLFLLELQKMMFQHKDQQVTRCSMWQLFFIEAIVGFPFTSAPHQSATVTRKA